MQQNSCRELRRLNKKFHAHFHSFAVPKDHSRVNGFYIPIPVGIPASCSPLLCINALYALYYVAHIYAMACLLIQIKYACTVFFCFPLAYWMSVKN